uniref:hypothetical protein n=1 Tax=Staphylococcus equorum TaxID=246432 RepID=UPI0025572396|nr:hypothetical protein [Staphylococcus equorum]
MGTSSLIYKEIEADSYKNFPRKERVLCGWTVGVLCGTGGSVMATICGLITSLGCIGATNYIYR